MPYSMFFEIQVNVAVTIKDPLGHICAWLSNWLQVCNVCVHRNKYLRHNTLLVDNVRHKLNGGLNLAHGCMM